jgi:hypothetical protein
MYTLNMSEFDYEEDGLAIYRGLIPAEAVDRYIDFLDDQFFSKGKRAKDDEYLRHEPVRDFLCHPAVEEKRRELGIVGGIHANLLNWIYEHVGWHSDRTDGMTRRFGIFYALDFMPAESGRFEIYPGSHKWGLDLVKCTVLPRAGTGNYLMDILSEVEEPPYSFDGGKGDVLFWRSECIHRRAEKQGYVLRKSAVVLCADDNQIQHKDGFWYCPF